MRIPAAIHTQAMQMIDNNKENVPILTPVSSTTNLNNTSGCLPLKRLKTSHGKFDATPSPVHQQEFSEDLCKLFVACGFSWNGVSNLEMKRFVHKWVPGVTLQDCRILLGQILDGEVAKVEERVVMKVKGKMATGQCDHCDGWENIAETHVVTSMMTVEHEVSAACYVNHKRSYSRIMV
jgi:hypothetical protein